jgi:hypothetical protein
VRTAERGSQSDSSRAHVKTKSECVSTTSTEEHRACIPKPMRGGCAGGEKRRLTFESARENKECANEGEGERGTKEGKATNGRQDTRWNQNKERIRDKSAKMGRRE